MCACVHGMCFYTTAGHAYISVVNPSLVSLMITYSIQKRCFLQDFITVRVCNSHAYGFYTHHPIYPVQMVAIEIIGEFYTLTIMNSCFSSVSVLVLASKQKTYCLFRTIWRACVKFILSVYKASLSLCLNYQQDSHDEIYHPFPNLPLPGTRLCLLLPLINFLPECMLTKHFSIFTILAL